MNYRVSKAENGDILVQERSGFAASRINGTWVAKIMFDAYQMRDELSVLQDKQEAERLRNEAHEALNTTKLMTA